jgi:hypothetical protein
MMWLVVVVPLQLFLWIGLTLWIARVVTYRSDSVAALSALERKASYA